MSVFAVIVTTPKDGVRERMQKIISEHIPKPNYLQVGDCLWFVESDFATSKELSASLAGENNEKDLSSYIVLPVNSYYGRHNKMVWEWLIAKGL